MTSLQTSIKQVGAASAYYIPIADIRGELFSYRTDIAQFSTCVWGAYAASGDTVASKVSTLVGSAGVAVLKDMGKTIVSSTRTFRKIQLVVPPPSDGFGYGSTTFGVGGAASTAGSDYYTGYIEMGFEGSGSPTKVARYGA